MNYYLLTAGGLSLVVCWIHVFLGGKDIARPLLESDDLGPVVKYTNYYCWHLVTIMIAGMGVMFLLAAFWQTTIVLAWAATVFASLFSLWNISLYIWKRQRLRHWYDLPQWVFFSPVAISGSLGLYFG